ncbi:MAG: hypothetical protein JNK14_21315 [Chitinophagaceae bacterium]|nr:hypothetical protein [Chitinophagaceae bacterium]
MKKLFVLGLVLTIIAASATAQGPRDRVRRERIERGFENRQLTRPEKFRLQKSQFRFKAERRRALRDGKVTPMERRRLHMMKRHDNREIFRLKHNGRRRVI